ncbi:MAG: type II/IV secretion system protein [Candidatus Liptonbacteria bacterium]|nr:type II/IV secretion system protein [Candidatus Liptonbacteria bacterium]
MPSNLQHQLAALQRDAEERDAERRAKTLGFPYVDLRKTPISLEAMKFLPEADAKATQTAAIQIRAHELALVMFDPHLEPAKKLVAGLIQKKLKVKIYVGSQSSLDQAWAFYRFISLPTADITGTLGVTAEELAELGAKINSFQALKVELDSLDYSRVGTAELYRRIIVGALQNKASDIHFEATQGGAEIRLRIDGLLHSAGDVPPKPYEHLLSRIKLVSEMKLNVKDEAQDGRFTITVAGKEIEVRVSIIPSEFGETVVMRILDPAGISVTLPELGLRSDLLKLVEQQLAKPNGLILNTGPTGSGKTTTLYAFLRHVLTPEIKIITVEDPIEYRIAGIEQTQIDPEAGYTFASGLRAILRQDPDVILVGEVRDQETADIALQAALTGHLVFSTLHTNDAVGAIPRLVDLGVKTATVGPALSLVIAQRLVRRLCAKCRKPQEVPAELRPKVRAFLEHLPPQVDQAPYAAFLADGPATVNTQTGCEACNQFGFRGRIGIFEFLETDQPEFQEAVLQSASHVALRKLAQEQKMTSMQADGILKFLAGLTTLAEVESVTGPIEW